MLRSIRRWWFWLTHRHEHLVIHRFSVIQKFDDLPVSFPAILERCCCGHEKARYWDTYSSRWIPLDLDWCNELFHRTGASIPARHP